MKLILGVLIALLWATPAFAASPVVATFATTTDTDGTSTVVTQPASATTGDLVINACAHNASTIPTISSGTNWTIRDSSTFVPGTSQSYITIAKVLDGTGDNLTIAATAVGTSCVSARITGHAVTNIATHLERGQSTGTSANPDPPACTQTLGSQDFLCLPIVWMDGTNTFTVMSTGYTEVAQANATTSVAVLMQRLAVTGTTDDPSATTSNASNGWVSRSYSIPSTLTPTSSTNVSNVGACVVLGVTGC